MPEDGETSDESNEPSLDVIAVLKELINSRVRASSQNGSAVVDTGGCADVGVRGCVSAGMAVNAGDAIKVGWGVAGGRAVGGGATSTGAEQLIRVKNISARKNIFSFIPYPFNKKTGRKFHQFIVLLSICVFSHFFRYPFDNLCHTADRVLQSFKCNFHDFGSHAF